MWQTSTSVALDLRAALVSHIEKLQGWSPQAKSLLTISMDFDVSVTINMSLLLEELMSQAHLDTIPLDLLGLWFPAWRNSLSLSQRSRMKLLSG